MRCVAMFGYLRGRVEKPLAHAPVRVPVGRNDAQPGVVQEPSYAPPVIAVARRGETNPGGPGILHRHLMALMDPIRIVTKPSSECARLAQIGDETGTFAFFSPCGCRIVCGLD